MTVEIICVLDKSGSMEMVATDARGGFNQFIKDQQKIGEANLTLIWFDHAFSVGYEGKLSEMKPIDEWPIGGMTALRDAIGFTFAHVKPRFTIESPEKVILAILTDGHENSSTEYSTEQVGNLIKEHREKYNWDVIFLGADQDAWEAVKDFHIDKNFVASYSSQDTRDGLNTYSSMVSKLRIK